MRQQKVTAQQVAERAGVSQTTVSFVLNRVAKANISAATRERVLQAAADLGYVPHVAARTLARGRSNNVGFVLTQPHARVFQDEYVPNLLTGMIHVFREHGYRILVELVASVEQLDTYRSLLKSKEVAGLIVQPYDPTTDEIRALRMLALGGFPIVSLSKLDPAISSVTADNLDGVRQALRHLIALGHRRIGCISYAPKDTDPHAMLRRDAYLATLTEHGLPTSPDLLKYGEYDPDTGYHAAMCLLRLDEPPTAIFGMNDVMAFGAMTAIQEHGLRVPEDVAVVGFDDIRLARYTTPALTTVQAPDIERGERVAQCLLHLMETPTPPPIHLELGTALVIRQSCGAHFAAPANTPGSSPERRDTAPRPLGKKE